MDIIKLVGIFLLIIVLLKFRLSLAISIACGAVATALLFGLNPINALGIAARSAVSWSTLSLLLIFYLITFLQRMLESRGQLTQAQQALNGLFNNRRVNASLAPIFIGLLPTAGAVTICGAMVDDACGDYLTVEEKTFVTTYFRHIPESFLPTYSSIILATQLSGVPINVFIAGMVPMVLVLVWLGYITYLRKVPKDTGTPPSVDKKQDLKSLWVSLWSLILTIALILVLDMPIYIALIIANLLNIFINKFKFEELRPMFRTAFEGKIMLSTLAIMILKDILTATGVVERLPDFFSQLPIPTAMVFALIFFFGTIVSGSTAIIVLCIPLAFAAMPGGGMPLLVLLNGCAYAAMQLSPTHVCLAVVTEYFHVEMGALVRKTLPIVGCFCAILGVYYIGLTLLV